MNITKRGSHYQIREMRKGKVITLTIDYKPSKKEALELLNIKENSVIKCNKTIYDAIELYIDSKSNTLSPSTIRGYTSLKELIKLNYSKFAELDLNEVDSLKMQKLINELSSKLSPKSVREYYSLIKSSIDMFVDKSFKVTLPMRIKSEPYIPNDNDIKKLLEITKGSIYDVPIKLAINGLRRSEIFALTMDDIGDGVININKAKVFSTAGLVTKATKTTGSTRKVVVSKELTNQIKKQGFIVNCHIGNLSRYLKIIHESYGLPHYSLHKLRHYYASMMMTLGVPSPYIMAQGGWSTDRVMKSIYTHTFPDTDFAEKGVAHIQSMTPL